MERNAFIDPRPYSRRNTTLAFRRGFTLTELIVVLAVVVLAAVVLLPAFVEASLTPNAAVCQNSLRAIGVANMVYADDNNDCLVPAKAQYYGGLSGTWHWIQLLMEPAGYESPLTGNYYGSMDDIFHGCPDRNLSDPAWNPGYGAVWILHGDYTKGTFLPSFSGSTGFWNYYYEDGASNPQVGFRRRNDFALPAQQGWVGDSSAWHIGGGSGEVYAPPNEYPNWCYPAYDGWTLGKDPERHGDSANYLFADGHVEYLHWSVSGNAFWNITKLLHPGDYNGDMVVDSADYTVWVDSFGPTYAAGHPADANGNLRVDIADYTIWADHFGEQRTYEAAVSQSAPLTASQQSAPAVSAEDDPPQSRRAARLIRARQRAERQARRSARTK